MDYTKRQEMTDEMPRPDERDIWRALKGVGTNNQRGETRSWADVRTPSLHGVVSSNGNIGTITDAAEEYLLRHPESE